MKPEEKKLLNDSLSKLYKVDPEKLASLYNEAGDLTDLSAVMEFDAQRIAKFQKDKEDQYKRGVKETAQKLEKSIKDKYGVESELEGVDLVDDILVKKIAETKSPESIQKHPEFIKARSEWEKEQKVRDKEWEKKIQDKELEFSKVKTFEAVKGKALALLAEANPILPADPKKAESWKAIYLKELENGNYQISDDGTIIVLDKEGNALKDAHGYSKTFADYAKELADKYFEYHVAKPRNSPGNKEPGGEPPANTTWPKNEDERLQLLRDPKITPERRKELTEFVIK